MTGKMTLAFTEMGRAERSRFRSVRRGAAKAVLDKLHLRCLLDIVDVQEAFGYDPDSRKNFVGGNTFKSHQC